MPNLRDTIAALVRRARSVRAAGSEAAAGMPRSLRPDEPSEKTDFGANPGRLRMFCHVPDGLPDNRPLVVVLHGCTQSADYARAAGWLTLASELNFAVLMPQQQASNNANTCFNWFEQADTMRDQGEAFSIWEMVERMIVDHRLDRRRVYVTGLSAGGAMACVMLATYPDVFAAGAIIGGLAYRCAVGVQQALAAMAHPQPPSMRAPGDLVRAASLHRGPWPRVSIWHGTQDRIVIPANAEAIARQWCDVHGLDDDAFARDTLDGHERRAWPDASGAVAVEAILVDGLGHGTPIDARGISGEPIGTPAPFVVDVGIGSTRRIAAQWNLGEPKATKPARGAPKAAPKQQAAASGNGGSLAALRKLLPRGLSPEASQLEGETQWERVSSEPGTYFGYASSGIGCVGGLHRKTLSRRLRVEAGQRLGYERRLHLHAGINIMTTAAFRVTIGGDTVDQEAVVFANRTDHYWTRHDIDLSRYAGREVDVRFEVSADCNVCIEVFAKAWVRGVEVRDGESVGQPAHSHAE